MNTRSAFKYTYLLTWLLWLNNQLHPMQIITLCSIGFLRILFGGNSAVEMFLHLTSFNKRIIRILFTEWSQSDKMLFITESTKNNSLAYLDNFLFPLNHSVGLQGILIIQLDQIFTYLSYCSNLKLFWERKSLEYLRLDRTMQNLIQAERYCRSVVLILRSLVVELDSFPLTNPDNAKTLNHQGARSFCHTDYLYVFSIFNTACIFS